VTEYFKKELSYIVDPRVLDIATQGVALIPDYFYHVPASSSGKYHPSYTVGDEGLYRHVKAAVAIARMLFQIHDFGSLEQDLILASLILHDGWKQGIDGSNGKTIHGHPTLAGKVLRERVELDTEAEIGLLEIVCDNIASHMGQWQSSKYDKEILPLPVTDMQRFVHLCDYICSRKPLEFNFSVEY
jgi:hypothetical protein